MLLPSLVDSALRRAAASTGSAILDIRAVVFLTMIADASHDHKPASPPTANRLREGECGQLVLLMLDSSAGHSWGSQASRPLRPVV